MRMEHIEQSADALTSSQLQASERAGVAAALCAAGLGLVLVYVSGFAQVEAIHNGAHDSRHSANFPCH